MLPNAISALRIAIIPFLLYSLHRDGDGVSAVTVSLLLVSGVTDLLDGYAARRLDQVSRLGRVLDPLADKALVGSLCVALVWWRGFPLWLMGLQIARDVAIVGAGLYLLRSRHLVVSSSWLGKAATVAMGLAVLGFVFSVPPEVKMVLTYGCGILVILSALHYGRILLHILAARGDS
ncbi:CDP-alcohol phosphatidyltransferase family protein [Candidatus Latescibacterota bacterium]